MAEKKEYKAGDIVHEDKENGVIYVVHPVTPEQKAELVRKGRILDAVFLD